MNKGKKYCTGLCVPRWHVSVYVQECVRVRVCVWNMVYLTSPLSVGNSQKEIGYHQGDRQTIVCLSKCSFANTWTPLPNCVGLLHVYGVKLRIFQNFFP